MLERRAPLQSGRDTEIDMIEREMEGGCIVIQPPELHEHSVEARLGVLIRVEEHVDVRSLRFMSPGAPKV